MYFILKPVVEPKMQKTEKMVPGLEGTDIMQSYRQKVVHSETL